MRRAGRRRLWLVAGLGGTVALLLWAKLRLISDVPRSVYADPKSQQRDR